VLGPLLFPLHVNDINNDIPEHNVKHFADDPNLLIASKLYIVFQAQKPVLDMNIWLQLNGIDINQVSS
jgi:hypothetical protein